MSQRPTIPVIGGVEPNVAKILTPIKAILEQITARAPNTASLKTLGPEANFSGVVSKVNEIIGRLQSEELPKSRSNTMYITTATFYKVENNLSEGTSSAATIRTNIGAASSTSSQSFSGGQRFAVTTLTSVGVIAPDFAVNNNFALNLTVNNTLGSASNVVVGQSGAIVITQDASPRTLAFDPFWKWAGTATGTVSTATGTVDLMEYHVYSTSAAVARMRNGLG